ncbi:hypothetical protein BDN72DRAFT_274192 [Pluteus cervinus]|uniref:Uncharacterized protein n=1 Tax=Pluteus cervinus TaxID=181527 RepID=A0ACD3AG23_9AGAR|nr:hypothetical protein BDN72DRAFT_274192 [Pluteus cervinus]
MSTDASPAFNISGLSKEDAYNKIESEVLRLKDQIRSLLSIRNSLSPVSNLPNELLAKVFMHCCDFDDSGRFSNLRPVDADESDGAQPEMRLVVSWVSRHWRNVAIGHRPLWNLVVNLKLEESQNLDYVRSCVARCQHLLFDLERPNPDLLDACVSNISQITLLKLDPSPHLSTLSTIGNGEIWSQPAPLLQTLWLEWTHIPFSDPHNVVYYPKLQSLTLFDCNFRWKFVASLASTLTRMDIRDPEHSWITIPDCVDLLVSLSLLSECILYSCLRGSAAMPRSSRARLPQLTKLTLADETPNILLILQAIDIPRASVQLILDKTESIDQDVAQVFGALRESHEHMWGSIRYLQQRNSLIIANSSPSLTHTITVSQSNSDILQLSVYQELDFSTLESLWMQFPSAEILQGFSHLKRLRRVVLESSSALENFVTYMCTGTFDNESVILFPALQELVLAGIETGNSEWLQGLFDILASRKIWGFGLPKLVLCQCDTVGIGDLARLEQVVDHVEFRHKTLRGFLVMR